MTLIEPVLGQIGMHGYGGSGWWMGGMMLWMAAFWIAVIWGGVWLARTFDGRGRSPRRAQEILDRRYAEGAISHEEYLERRGVIQAEKNPSQTDGSDMTGTSASSG